MAFWDEGMPAILTLLEQKTGLPVRSRTPCVADHLLRVRLSERALCLNDCASNASNPSHPMCAGKDALLRVGPYIIARRYR
jgi:hypothetical protein